MSKPIVNVLAPLALSPPSDPVVAGINISQVCERGLAEVIAEMRAERWLEENRAALVSSNAWVEGNGLPLAGKRLF